MAQLTVRTMVPEGCSTVMTPLVKAMSVIVSVQPVLGQSGAPGIGDAGAVVVTENVTFPFSISSAGIA